MDERSARDNFMAYRILQVADYGVKIGNPGLFFGVGRRTTDDIKADRWHDFSRGSPRGKAMQHYRWLQRYPKIIPLILNELSQTRTEQARPGAAWRGALTGRTKRCAR